jgi:2-polyprenyl-3-methyl-5-hydroxy-6-metoxy-1,4-benzoquinol methylase
MRPAWATGLSQLTARPRPPRADLVVSCDLASERYESSWGPAILPGAVGLRSRLELAEDAVVLDVGAGTGSLAPSIRQAGPYASPLAIDDSAERCVSCTDRGPAPRWRAEVVVLPGVPRWDAVVLAYVLFHSADPPVAYRRPPGVLRPGGRVGTVTWASNRPERAQLI